MLYFLVGIEIKSYYRCKKKFFDSNKEPPNDMVKFQVPGCER